MWSWQLSWRSSPGEGGSLWGQLGVSPLTSLCFSSFSLGVDPPFLHCLGRDVKKKRKKNNKKQKNACERTLKNLQKSYETRGTIKGFADIIGSGQSSIPVWWFYLLRRPDVKGHKLSTLKRSKNVLWPRTPYNARVLFMALPENCPPSCHCIASVTGSSPPTSY